jgi:hypothetical protein
MSLDVSLSKIRVVVFGRRGLGLADLLYHTRPPRKPAAWDFLPFEDGSPVAGTAIPGGGRQARATRLT